jgi:hypothetical protein
MKNGSGAFVFLALVLSPRGTFYEPGWLQAAAGHFDAMGRRNKPFTALSAIRSDVFSS